MGLDEEQLASNGSRSTCPLLAVRDLHQNQISYHQKSDFPEALVQATLHCVGQISLRMENLDISLRVWIWRRSLFCLLN